MSKKCTSQLVFTGRPSMACYKQEAIMYVEAAA